MSNTKYPCRCRADPPSWRPIRSNVVGYLGKAPGSPPSDTRTQLLNGRLALGCAAPVERAVARFPADLVPGLTWWPAALSDVSLGEPQAMCVCAEPLDTGPAETSVETNTVFAFPHDQTNARKMLEEHRLASSPLLLQ